VKKNRDPEIEFSALCGGAMAGAVFDLSATWPLLRITVWATGLVVEQNGGKGFWSRPWSELAGAQVSRRGTVLHPRNGRGVRVNLLFRRQQRRLNEILLDHGVAVEHVRFTFALPW
jgi:hypothetical protein